MRFGKAADGNDPFRQSRREARDLSSGRQARVNLVRNDPEIVPASDCANRGQLCLAKNDAARVIRSGPEDRTGARGDERLERAHIGAEARPRGRPNEARARDFNGGGISRIERVEGNNLVPGAGKAERGDKQCVLRAGQTQHVVGPHRLSRAFRMGFRDGLAKRRPTPRGSVVRVAGRGAARPRALLPPPARLYRGRRY